MRSFRMLWRYPVITIAAIILVAVLVLHSFGEEAASRWLATGSVSAFVAWTLVGMVRDLDDPGHARGGRALEHGVAVCVELGVAQVRVRVDEGHRAGKRASSDRASGSRSAAR